MVRVAMEAVFDGIFWGIALAALVSCLQARTRRTNAGTRHAVWCCTLAAVVLLPILTFAARYATAGNTPDTPMQPGSFYPLCAMWGFGSVLMLARLGLSARRLWRLVRAATPIEAAGEVPVLCSTAITSPMAAGLSATVILIPAGLAARLSAAEMQHVLLHETAHIRRGDLWINLWQRLAESLFFFHPAVWWIGRQLRFECEVACDDWVVAATGAAREYARSLTRLVELTMFRRGPALATAALTSKPRISRRIEMLLERERGRSPQPAAFGIASAALLIAAFVLCCAYAPSVFAFGGVQSAASRSMSVCRSNFWSSFTLKSRGEVEFAASDRDVRSISPGGSLMIEEREGLTWRKLTFTPRAGGVDHAFSLNGATGLFEPDGRRWMEEILPRVIRETGVGAAARVERILRQGGADAVLAEISRIDSARSKRIYFQELIARTPDAALLPRILRQAAHDMDSDADRRRLYVSLLDRAPLIPDLLQAAARLHSDSEKAGFLLDTLRYSPTGEATRSAYFKTLNTIGSDGERRRVLGALLRRPLAHEEAARIFHAAAKLNSDGEKTGVLVEGARELPGSAGARVAWFHAVATIQSDGERRRALEAVLRRDGRDREMLLTIVRSATAMDRDTDKAAVLAQVARVCPDDDAVVQAIVDSAQTLHSDVEYRRVITPLVRRGRGLRVIHKI